jgi:hypothetical protein
LNRRPLDPQWPLRLFLAGLPPLARAAKLLVIRLFRVLSNTGLCRSLTRGLRSNFGQTIMIEVIFMGWSRKRLGQGGRERCTAYYRDARGHTCVAGTFARKKDADRAWQAAEVRLAEGRLGDRRRGRQTFRRYVEQEWLPNHVMEATTREGYTYSIYKHLMPWFGPMRMNQIKSADVREWVTHLTQPGSARRTCARSRAS